MAQIKKKNIYPPDSVVVDKDMVIGTDYNALDKTKNYLMKDIKDYIINSIPGFDQNNLIPQTSVSLSNFASPIAVDTLIQNYLNTITLVVTEKQLPLYRFYVINDELDITKNVTYIYLWGLGKGTYIHPLLTDFRKINISSPSFEDIESQANTVTLELGVISILTTFVDIINNYPTPINFNDPLLIYLVTFTQDNEVFFYKFIGDNDIYGYGLAQCTIDDFESLQFNSLIGATDLGYIPTPTNGIVTSNTGNDAIIPLADLTNAGLITAVEKAEIATALQSGDNVSVLLNDANYVTDIELTAVEDRVEILENLQNLNTNFTGQAYAIWTGVGLIYDVIYPNYYIEGVLYLASTEQITLDIADPTDPRQDIIAVDATGAIKKTGVASPDPAAPSVDSLTEIYISTVLVATGATTPTGVSNINIYKENVEWTTSSDIGTIDFNSTSIPFEGTKNIETSAFTAGKYILFSDIATHNYTNYDTIRLRIYLKATFTNSTKFLFYFFNGGTAVSILVTLNSGQYGFNRTTINQWQDIIIPLSAFTFQSPFFDKFEIITIGSNASGFKIDNVILNTGVGGSNPLQKAIISVVANSGVANATQADDSIQILGTGKTTTSATGKVVTINTPTEVVNTITDGDTTHSPNGDILFDALALKQDVLTDANFGTFENSLTAKATPIDADIITIVDTADSNKAKKTTFTQLKAFLKTYWDTLYQVILVSGTNIKTINGSSILGSGDLVVGGAGSTDLGYTASPTDGTVTSSTGADATLPLADGTNAGLLKPAKYTVLENTSGTNTGDQDLSGLQSKGVCITNATTTGSYAVDWNAGDVWQLTLTGATTITDTNLPTGTATKVIELMVKGAFAITLPSYWEAVPASGAYTGAKWNHIVVSCIVGTTSSEKVIYSNEVLAT